MGERIGVSDKEWALIGPLLPSERGRGCRPAWDNRRYFEGMIWIVRTGAQWRHLPDEIARRTAFSGVSADGVRPACSMPEVEAVIPAKSNPRTPAPHDRVKYRWRNLIERLFNKLKNSRRSAARYYKTRESYLDFSGFSVLASVKLWIPVVYEA